MLKDRDKLYQAYHALLSMLLTCVLTLVSNQYFQLRINHIICFLLTVPFAAGIYFFDYYKKNSVRYLVLISFLPIIASIFFFGKINPVRWLQNLIEWCLNYDGSEKLYVASNAYIILLGIALAGAVLFYLLVNKELTRILLAVLIILLLIILCVRKINVDKVIVGISVFYMVSIMIELYGMIYSKRTKTAEKKAGMIYLVPICLLLSLIAVGMPSKEDPIQWSGIKKMYQDLQHQIALWKTDLDYYFANGSGDFAVSFAGFSEDNGNLGAGDLEQNDKISLKINGKVDNKPTYLIGSVSNIYTGHSWEKSGSDDIDGGDEYVLDYIELLGALSRQEIRTLKEESLINREILTIEFDNIKTKTLFYPIKSSTFTLMYWNPHIVSHNPNIKFTKPKKEGTQYKTLFFDMELGNEAFQNMLRDADAFSYDSEDCFHEAALQWMREDIIKNDSVFVKQKEEEYQRLLKERSDMIHREYTKLPGNLPDRVKDLAESITKDYDTTYDKLKAIEKYLKNFSYDVQPGELPDEYDFVDYFLFENKKGYCTYFATSMAVLARCIGIPTRYIEGFVVTYHDGNRAPGSSTTYLVRNNQAHAWTEAYLEGVGWIPFEATPPFYDLRYALREVRNYAPAEYNYGGEYLNAPTEIPEWLLNSDENAADETNLQGNHKLGLTMTIIIVAVILILMMSVCLYYNIVRYQYKKNFNKADNTGKMYLTFLRILRILKREGYYLEQQETLLMMARRIKNYYCYEGITYSDIVHIYMKFRYAQEDITDKELHKTERFYKGLEERQREKRSRLAILFEEFLFLSKKSNR